MYLKSIELYGFKSFPQKTSIKFEGGITAIIGPNGSGKSNISDAVRWVFGEMSTKVLRGNKMEDVIFSGTKDYKPASFTRVSLIIDNSDRKADIDSSEIKITRQLTRSGDSGYFINDKNVRQKDIYELFLNTGIGKEGYSVIGQGKIAEFISKKSEERKAIFEEASGISKYRYKKTEAERKLESVNENLVRVTDILSEITSRVEPLRIESEKAKAYLELYEKKKKSEIYSFTNLIQKLKAELDKSAGDFELSRINYEFICSDIDKLNHSSDEIYTKNQRINLEYEQTRIEKFNILNSNTELKSKIENNKNESERIRLEDYAGERSLGENTQKIEEDNKIYTEKLAVLDNINSEYKTMEMRIEDKHSHAEFLNQNINAKLTEDNNLILRQRETEKNCNDIKLELANAENNIRHKNERTEEIELEIERTNDEIDINKSEIKLFCDEKTELGARLSEKSSENFKADFKLKEIKKNIDQNKNQSNELYLNNEKNKKYLENLKHLTENLEGFSEGAKRISKEAKSGGLSGVIGTIADIIDVNRDYITALEIALGQNIQNIVVEDEKSAIDAMEFLKSGNFGRATFYPMTTVRGLKIPQNELKSKPLHGILGIASELVKYERIYDDIISYLLGRTIVCDTIENASLTAKTLSYKYKIVTLDGQVINAGGSYTGGSAGKRSSILSNKSDITELTEKIKTESTELAKLQTLADSYSKALTRAENEKSEIEHVLTYLKQEIVASDSQINIKNVIIENLRRQIQKLENDIEQINNSDDESNIAEYTRKLEMLETELNQITEKLNLCREKLKETQLEKEILNLKINKEQLFLAEITNKKNIENERLENLQKEITARKSKNLVIIKEGEERTKKRESIGAESQSYQSQIKENDAKLLIFDKNIEHIENQKLENERISNEIRNLLKDKTSAKEVVFREMTKAESQKQNKEKEHDTVIGRLWDEYEFTHSQAEEYIKNTTLTEEETTPKYLNGLRDKIKSLGNVNVGAIEEYKELYERHKFLSEQSEDLSGSIVKLSEIIDNLGEQMKNVFVASMQQINLNFKEVFSELFGGGYAQIIFTDPENVLESELEIEVQPPGKNVKHISLLSGGEQAFVAIALYFALLKINPAPFCILDEIEAALDEVNVDRFAAYIKKYSSNTQFIIISHRRGTMESADRLYGITMEEKGISRYLTLDMKEAERKLGLSL